MLTMDHYERAVTKGIEWLLSQQNSDGSMDPVEQGVGGYYKVPYALALTGHGVAGCRLLDWVRDNNFTEVGDFSGRFPRMGPHEHYYHYANSWLVCGAQKLGQFDLAYRGCEFLLGLQDETGGFPTRGPNAKPGEDSDLMSTPVAALACLYVGQTEAARKTGDLLVTILDEQPSPEDRLYFIHNRSGLVTDFPEDEATGFVIDVSKEKQWYFICGVCAAFLVHLCRATSAARYVEAAKTYLDFIPHCHQDRYSTPQSGKLAWGAASLYGLTGDEHYAKMARAVGDYLVETQHDDGTWRNPAVDPSARYVTMDVTAEFVVLLSEMMQGLAMGGR
ncbi:MAG: prenyltransferase/squalene oxidase repeat-containing protein [Armatimonadota bacterium]